MSVSMAGEAVAVTVNSAGTLGSVPTTRAAWSRCTRLSRPSTTGTPASVTAEPIAAKTAGQQQADQRVGHGGEAGRQRLAEGGRDTGVVGDPLGVPVHRHGGRPVDDRGQELRPVDTGGDRQHRAHGGGGVFGGHHRGAAVDGVGGQGERDVDPGARHRHAQHHARSPSTCSRAPVDECVARRLSGPSCTSQSPGSAMRCTGLVAVRPAHSTSGASSTTASGPVTSARPRRRDATARGCRAGEPAPRRWRPARSGPAIRRRVRRSG